VQVSPPCAAEFKGYVPVLQTEVWQGLQPAKQRAGEREGVLRVMAAPHRSSPVAVVPPASLRSQLDHDQGDQGGGKAAGCHKRQELDYGGHRHTVRPSSRTSFHKTF
jgi:hypothetical protein